MPKPPSKTETMPGNLAGINGLRSVPVARGPVVYFLCLEGKVVYVGCSTNLNNRLATHDGNHVPFDHVYFVPVESKKEGHKIEQQYLRGMLPPLNFRYVYSDSGINDPREIRAKKWRRSVDDDPAEIKRKVWA